MLEVRDLKAGYGAVEVLRGVSFDVGAGEIVALLGSNGNGKSTFAKFISGRLAPQAGDLRVAPGLKIGFFAQHQLDDLVPDETPVEHVRKLMPLAPEAALVFALSPLVGTPLTTSAKFAVVAKSPLTGRLNDALSSSHFALAAKRAGIDGTPTAAALQRRHARGCM